MFIPKANNSHYRSVENVDSFFVNSFTNFKSFEVDENDGEESKDSPHKIADHV